MGAPPRAVLPLTAAELAAYHRDIGPSRAALMHAASRARMLSATIHRGEAMTGRALGDDLAQLDAALLALEPPAPPPPPEWKPDP